MARSFNTPCPEPFKLTPSSLTYAWDQCRCCFYRKVVFSEQQPGTFPSVFRKIDQTERDYFHGKHTYELGLDLPSGTLDCSGSFFKSGVIALPGAQASIYFSCQLDCLITFDDGTFGIVDFKTCELRDKYVAAYSRQLHACALALENPKPGFKARVPVSVLGVLCFEPSCLVNIKGKRNNFSFLTQHSWTPFEREDRQFMAFLAEVADVLTQQTPPPADPNCPLCSFCAYRAGWVA